MVKIFLTVGVNPNISITLEFIWSLTFILRFLISSLSVALLSLTLVNSRFKSIKLSLNIFLEHCANLCVP